MDSSHTPKSVQNTMATCSEHEHMCARVCFWGLFRGCVVGWLAALVLGAFAALFLLVAS